MDAQVKTLNKLLDFGVSCFPNNRICKTCSKSKTMEEMPRGAFECLNCDHVKGEFEQEMMFEKYSNEGHEFDGEGRIVG